MTSSAERFEQAAIPRNMVVRLEPGDYPFVTKRTVIDLTDPHSEDLTAIVSAPSFKFVVQLSAKHMAAIDDAVRASTVIVRKVKKMILADYG